MYKLGTTVVNTFSIGETSQPFTSANHRVRVVPPSGQNVALDTLAGRTELAPTPTTIGYIDTSVTLNEVGIWKIEYVLLSGVEPKILYTNYLYVVAPTTLIECSPIDKAAYAL